MKKKQPKLVKLAQNDWWRYVHPDGMVAIYTQRKSQGLLTVERSVYLLEKAKCAILKEGIG